MKQCYGVIAADDLTEDGPREIYKTMLRLHEKEESWNPVILKSEIRSQENYAHYFRDIGEPLDERVFDNLIKNLKIATARRRIHSFLFRQYNGIWENDPIVVASEALTFFTNLDVKMSHNDSKNLRNSITGHLALMRERYAGHTIGVSTGFPDLDFMLGQGLKKKEVIVPAARPSVGKTSFSLSVAYNAAKLGYNVLFITIEMDDTGILDRLMSFQTGIPLTSIIRGKAPKERIKQGYRDLKALPLTIKFMPSPTSAEIHSLASKHKYTHGLDLLVVDYLGLVDKDSDRDDVTKLGKTMINFKSIANMLDTAVLVPHQLNRKVEHRPKEQRDPLLSDLRGSGQIEEHAAIVMFLTRDTIGTSGEKVSLRISKNRYGETGVMNLRFNPLTTKFEQK